MKLHVSRIISTVILSAALLLSACSKKDDGDGAEGSMTGENLSSTADPALDEEEGMAKLKPKSKKDYLNGSDLPEVSIAVNAKEEAMADLPECITIKGVEYSTRLTSLTLNNMGLTNEDIADLKYMINLTELHVYQNNISDLTPITGLTNLQTLSLFKNNISDLKPLSGLTDLRTLYLRNNEITDITPLKNLTQLTNLDLSDNKISDISALSGMTKMKLLKLNNNEIHNISAVEGMTAMDRIHLQNNKITDIMPLWRMSAVTEIYLDSNEITDITPLTELKGLGWLKLSHNPIEDLSPVYELDGMKKMYLIGINMKKTEDFNELEYLQEHLPECTIVTK